MTWGTAEAPTPSCEEHVGLHFVGMWVVVVYLILDTNKKIQR